MSYSKIESIESNRQFLLKNHSKAISHLKAGIVTAVQHYQIELCINNLAYFESSLQSFR